MPKISVLHILHFYCLMTLSASLSLGQSHIEEVFLNTPLIDVLNKLQSDYDYYFAFEKEDIENVYVHKFVFEDNMLDALTRILTQTGLEYQSTDERKILIRKSLSDNSLSDHFIKGIVTSSQDGLPLAWANIVDISSNYGAYSDDNGKFILKIPGNKNRGRLMVSYLGYENSSISWSASEADLKISLNPSAYQIQEVRVVYKIPEIENIQADTLIQYDRYQYGINLTSLGMNDALRKMKYMPGVKNTNDLEAGLQIRGGSSDENLYIMNGIKFF